MRQMRKAMSVCLHDYTTSLATYVLFLGLRLLAVYNNDGVWDGNLTGE